MMLSNNAGAFFAIAIASAIAGLAVSGGCTSGGSATGGDGGLTFEGSTTAKTRFIEDNVAATGSGSWLPQDVINVTSDGVAVSVNGGVEVIAETGRTKVEATARIVAMALSGEKVNADTSIQEVKATFVITKVQGLIRLTCGHGQTHGSSAAGDSGCEKVTVRVPAATAAEPLGLQVSSGNGTVNLSLSSLALLSLDVDAQGDIDAKVSATRGGRISLKALKADDVVLHLPEDFAANEIVFNADADKQVNDFTDAKIGAGAGGRGAADTGLASIVLTSISFAGSTGTVKLTR